MKLHRFVSILLLVLTAALTLTGCMGKVIAEDPMYQHLPDVDPDDGVEKNLNVTLYYRLTNEGYLVGIDSSITVMAGERAENAVIRALVEGVPMMVSDVSALFPTGTTIEDVLLENGILYVTLSPEFLSESIVNSIDREVYLSEESYYEAIYLATKEMYLVRKLAALSIVNTITGGGEGVKVQLMVMGEDGNPRRFTKEELGFDDEEGFVEALSFDKEILVDSEKVMECFLDNMAHREYEKAYVLCAENDHTGTPRPHYADFEAQIKATGNMSSYEITGMHSDDVGEYALANFSYTMTDGVIKQVKNARMYIEYEGILPKVSYGSLKNLMENLTNESSE